MRVIKHDKNNIMSQNVIFNESINGSSFPMVFLNASDLLLVIIIDDR